MIDKSDIENKDPYNVLSSAAVKLKGLAGLFDHESDSHVIELYGGAGIGIALILRDISDEIEECSDLCLEKEGHHVIS